MATIRPTNRMRSIPSRSETPSLPRSAARRCWGEVGGGNSLPFDLSFSLELRDVDARRLRAEQVLREVVDTPPEHVIAIRRVAVPLAGQQDEVEALVRANERVDDAIRVGRVHVVVDVARDEEQMAFQVLGDVLVLVDVVLERDLAVSYTH